MSASAIRDIRRNNLRLLIAERFEGVRARFARAVGAHDSHVNNIFSPREEHRRSVGEDTARRYEELLGLPRCWLDTEQVASSVPRLFSSSAVKPSVQSSQTESKTTLELGELSSLQAATLSFMHQLMRQNVFTDLDAIDLLSRARNKAQTESAVQP